MAKFRSVFNGNEVPIDAYWVPELEMWCVPSESNYIAYLWDNNEFMANFEQFEDDIE